MNDFKILIDAYNNSLEAKISSVFDNFESCCLDSEEDKQKLLTQLTAVLTLSFSDDRQSLNKSRDI